MKNKLLYLAYIFSVSLSASNQEGTLSTCQNCDNRNCDNKEQVERRAFPYLSPEGQNAVLYAQDVRVLTGFNFPKPGESLPAQPGVKTDCKGSGSSAATDEEDSDSEPDNDAYRALVDQQRRWLEKIEESRRAVNGVESAFGLSPECPSFKSGGTMRHTFSRTSSSTDK